MEKHTVHVNGIDMVYEECGSGNKKTVILLHGFCGSSRYWHKVCPLLSDNYRIIMPQLRGHGETTAPEGAYTMELMADDVLCLMDKLGIHKASLFGHSLGGYITLAFADQYPHRLAGLGLIHSTALPDSETMKQKRLEDIDTIREGGIAAYISELIPKLFLESKREEKQEDVDEFIRAGKRMKPEGAIHTLEGMMQRPDRSKVLAKANFPILLVAGAKDDVISPIATFSLTESGAYKSTYDYPHISENTFEGVAHMSLVEAPDQLSRVIANYLKTLNEKETVRTK
ncbi:alpha/beta fold hydrolase [Paenibacillus sp. NPDC058174]|uniref:alpha/beta fold hydrolase n=1 Tax=Paenibacillus sp. NPDC058174 TaxID=3346366 RepID=UPI0036DB826F